MSKKDSEKEVLGKKRLSKDDLADLSSQLDAMSENGGGLQAPPTSVPAYSNTPPPVLSPLSPVAAGQTMQEAFLQEGMDAGFFAQKLKFLLSEDAKTPKWNKELERWDYFIDGELWRKICDMGIKIHGGYAPEASISVHIDANLQDILQNTNVNPEEANRQVRAYFEEISGSIGETADFLQGVVDVDAKATEAES
jgi:hypothetical protein